MRLSHIHVAFRDLEAAVAWFKAVLCQVPSEESAHTVVFRFEDLEVAMHPDWGDGDTSATLAFLTDDCQRELDAIVARGAKLRSAPRDKGDSINADVYGPGKLIVELEQRKTSSRTRDA